MKRISKIFILLFIFAFAMFSITTAKADMSAPEMREFEVEVINSNGADYTDYKGTVIGHLEQGETVYVMYEYNGQYTIGKKVTKYGVERSESIGYVTSLEDFDIVEDTVDPTLNLDDKNIKVFDTAQKAIVYAEDGVDVYSGPSDVYEKVGHIIKGTKLTYKYAIIGYEGSNGMTAIYVTYGNVKGWISILKEAVLVENDAQYVFKTDIETKCGTIPKNTVTTPTYKSDIWSGETLFEYNNCEALVKTFKSDKIFTIYSATNKANTDINIYKTADETSEVIGTIPAGSEYTKLAEDAASYSLDTTNVIYVKYNGLTGWVFDAPGASELISYDEETVKLEDTVKVEDKTDVVAEEEKTTTNKKMSLTTLIILCSCGVGFLAITALVIIILVNKSRKPKVEPVVETTEEK